MLLHGYGYTSVIPAAGDGCWDFDRIIMAGDLSKTTSVVKTGCNRTARHASNRHLLAALAFS
ncbi:hypothetical protein HanIR_Chr15g0770331 [Helianthus annuus]|nr:hypothetical protein HanIR_Chr15g0770331 [Helianthus annuus]